MYRNYAKDFDYAIEINGLDQFLAQDIKLPTVSHETVPHGAPGPVPNMNTPGKPVIGDMVIQKLIPTEGDSWAWRWYAEALAGGLPTFAKSAFVKLRQPGFGPTSNKYLLRNIWVKEIDTSNLIAQGSNNIIETVTFEVHVMHPTNVPEFKRLFN